MGRCTCSTPVPRTQAGVSFCEECGERLPDARDRALARIALGVGKVERQLGELAERSNGQRPGLALEMPAEWIEAVAERAAAILAERSGSNAGDGWLRGADKIAAYLDCPRSRVYALASCTPPRIPIERDGSSLIARRSELDEWVRRGGGVRA
jgi:hypothetical protein